MRKPIEWQEAGGRARLYVGRALDFEPAEAADLTAALGAMPATDRAALLGAFWGDLGRLAAAEVERDAALAERDEARVLLSTACAEREAVRRQLRNERNGAAGLRDALATMKKERDEARGQCAQVAVALAQVAAERDRYRERLAISPGGDDAIDGLSDAVRMLHAAEARLVAERDAARRERDEARASLDLERATNARLWKRIDLDPDGRGLVLPDGWRWTPDHHGGWAVRDRDGEEIGCVVHRGADCYTWHCGAHGGQAPGVLPACLALVASLRGRFGAPATSTVEAERDTALRERDEARAQVRTLVHAAVRERFAAAMGRTIEVPRLEVTINGEPLRWEGFPVKVGDVATSVKVPRYPLRPGSRFDGGIVDADGDRLTLERRNRGALVVCKSPQGGSSRPWLADVLSLAEREGLL